jgi:hypothetical protein
VSRKNNWVDIGRVYIGNGLAQMNMEQCVPKSKHKIQKPEDRPNERMQQASPSPSPFDRARVT